MDISSRSLWHNKEFVEKVGGFFPPNGSRRTINDLEPWDSVRRDMLVLLLRQVIANDIEGDFAELGVYRGSTARLIHHYAPERKLHLFDTFEGFTQKDVKADAEKFGVEVRPGHFTETSAEAVKRYIEPQTENVFFHVGAFPETISSPIESLKFAFVHLDADIYEPMKSGLEFFYPRVSPGGIIVAHDYNAWHGARHAVDGFFANKMETPIPMPDKSGSAVIVKLADVSG